MQRAAKRVDDVIAPDVTDDVTETGEDAALDETLGAVTTRLDELAHLSRQLRAQAAAVGRGRVRRLPCVCVRRRERQNYRLTYTNSICVENNKQRPLKRVSECNRASKNVSIYH